MESIAEKALSMGMQVGELQEEVDSLNEKYKAALRDKVHVYDEMAESLKEKVSRNCRALRNMLDMAKTASMVSVMKREMD